MFTKFHEFADADLCIVRDALAFLIYHTNKEGQPLRPGLEDLYGEALDECTMRVEDAEFDAKSDRATCPDCGGFSEYPAQPYCENPAHEH